MIRVTEVGGKGRDVLINPASVVSAQMDTVDVRPKETVECVRLSFGTARADLFIRGTLDDLQFLEDRDAMPETKRLHEQREANEKAKVEAEREEKAAKEAEEKAIAKAKEDAAKAREEARAKPAHVQHEKSKR